MSDAQKISVELKNIVQQYPLNGGVNTVVDNVSLAFTKPSINMILGPSGSGKSTILRMMGGVRPEGVKTPTSGEVFIHGEPCVDNHPDAVMVFQRYANRPDKTVYENVFFPFTLDLWKNKVPLKEQKERVEQIISAVGLEKQRDLYTYQLSGGQNQRVALARALVVQPKILLMDEPFGALDAQTREDMQKLLLSLYQKNPCIVVFVTHDVTEALVLGDRIILLSTNPATIADDFYITVPRPRSHDWLRSAEGNVMYNRIINKLQAANNKGEVAVSI